MIIMYCGDWNLIPEVSKAGIVVRSWTTETQQEMFDHGTQIASRVDDYMFFTNNDHVLHGIQLAIKARRQKENPRDLGIIFYSVGYPSGYYLYVDCDGNLSSQPAGFFDQNEIALIKLF